MHRSLRRAVCGMLLLTACGGSEPSPTVEQVLVSPTDTTLGLPDTVQLSAQALDDQGQLVGGATVTWISSNPAIATVSSTGLVASQAEGTATVRAQVAGVEGNTRVVVQVPVMSLTVEPGSATIPTFGTRQFSVTATGTDGEPITPDGATWSVSDPGLASVDAQGLVTAIAPGSIVVSATFRGVTASTTVTIGPPAVARVELWQSNRGSPGVPVTVVPLNATVPLRAVPFDIQGHVLPPRPAAWSSTVTATMEVDDTGLVRAAGAGSSVISATVEGVQSAGTALTVLIMPPLTELAVGDYRTCAIATGGDAYCWGYYPYGGAETESTGDAPVRVGGGHAWAQLTVGALHTCGLTTAGTAYCWGRNQFGQVGDGTTGDRPVPTPVTGGRVFQSISAGYGYTCGVTTAKAAYCWGRNERGQLGIGSVASGTDSHPVPLAVDGSIAFETISTSRVELPPAVVTCGVSSGGDGYCWGLNDFGQLGTGDSVLSPSPRLVAGGHEWQRISASTFHSCGVTTSGTARCWGVNVSGAFGNGSEVDDPEPTPVLGGPYSTISTGYRFTCAIETGGDLVCFGYNGSWELGLDGLSQSEVPANPAPGLVFTRVGAGREHACGLTVAGVAYCWGGLGNGSNNTQFVHTPQKVVGQQ